MAIQHMQPARFLKILVVALGLAIVVALGFVIYGFVRLGSGSDPAIPVASDVSTPAVADLGQPAGSEIFGAVSAGSTRVALNVRGGGLPDRVVVIDVRTGKAVTTTYLSPPQ
jgi:hypothetical protein